MGLPQPLCPLPASKEPLSFLRPGACGLMVGHSELRRPLPSETLSQQRGNVSSCRRDLLGSGSVCLSITPPPPPADLSTPTSCHLASLFFSHFFLIVPSIHSAYSLPKTWTWTWLFPLPGMLFPTLLFSQGLFSLISSWLRSHLLRDSLSGYLAEMCPPHQQHTPRIISFRCMIFLPGTYHF